jgi:copper homeostasis protein (lipoprotein)
MRRFPAGWLVMVVLVGFSFGCGGGKGDAETGDGEPVAEGPPAAAVTIAELGKLEGPVTFVGVVPCADCPGIQVTLTLRPDGLFFRRDTYLEAEGGTDVTVLDRGTWTSGENVLVLTGERNAPRHYAIQDAATLRMLDATGQEIDSSLPYNMLRIPRADPFEDAFRLEGMYRYMADAGLFTDCSTGREWPVAMESANADLERAYLQARHEPGEPVWVRVVGRFLLRPPMEGPENVEMLVVDEVVEVDPEGICDKGP